MTIEGIVDYEEFRDDLTLMYFPTVEPATGPLVSLRLTPMRIRGLRFNQAAPTDTEWLRSTLHRIREPFGTHIEHIAAVVGASRPRVSVMLKRLERDGVFVREGKHILVDPKSLRRHLERKCAFLL